jgi:DNA-directed RNA polymerase specialized sigma24 family protein
MAIDHLNNGSMNKKNIGFPSTMWTDIAMWKNASKKVRESLLHRFYQRYRLPLLIFLRRIGCSPTETDDVLHDFILSHIKGRIFISADVTKGRFRNLLLTSLKHFLASHKRAQNAEKRIPEGGFAFLDEEMADGLPLKSLLQDRRTPDEIYERAWLLALLNNVIERLHNEYAEKGQEIHYTLFERRVIHPIIYGLHQPSVIELAIELGLSPAKASNCIVTAKRAFKRHLRNEILEYVSTEKEVSEEISDLMYFLQNINR